MKISLKTIDSKIKVTSPYSAEFVSKARNLKGSWENGAWWFDVNHIEYVRELMIEIYGVTGETPYEECSLLISDYTSQQNRNAVTLFNRTVAKASGRDSGAKLGDDIIFIKGEYGSCGSVKNWRTYVEDATFEIQNFPTPALNLTEVKKAIEEGWCKVKHAQQIDIESIKEEILKLEQRIIELKRLIH